MNKFTLYSGLVFALFISGFCIGESRSFIRIDNKNYITVWKIFGDCCIIPYKYYGITKPVNNYIRTTPFNTVTIIYDKNLSTDFSVLNNMNEYIYQKFDKYNVKYYDIAKQDLFFKYYYCGDKVCSRYKYVIAYLREDNYFVNGKLL